MPTYQVTCAWCGEDRWPTLPERPRSYTCVRCLAVPENVRQRRREQGQKSAAKRKGAA